jgi:hypothetical protein
MSRFQTRRRKGGSRELTRWIPLLVANALLPGCTGRVHTSVSAVIHAPPEQVVAVYLDYAAWPRIFPKTIKGVRLVREEDRTKTLEIDHVEGSVVNVLSVVGPGEIHLMEWKRRYDARFTNRFERTAEGTRYSLIADVVLKGGLRPLAPIAGPQVRARMRKFVVEPLKQACERSPDGP